MFCPNCGTQSSDGSLVCASCNFNLQDPNKQLDQRESGVVSSVLPIGRTGLSIAAGYLGLFCIIPIFAPISLVVSILALRQLKNNPGKLGKGRAVFGLIMGLLGTGFMAAIIITKLIS